MSMPMKKMREFKNHTLVHQVNNKKNGTQKSDV
jgi:hypothetical protein